MCLQVYEVSLSYQIIERTRFCDGQTDRQTVAREKTICLPTLKGGDITKVVLNVKEAL